MTLGYVITAGNFYDVARMHVQQQA